jgi:glycosyltransferase involved in cell wall biosynthesis
VVHNGVPLPDAERDAASAGDELVIGTLAAIAPRKGSDVFVEAARRVREETDAVRFRMVGGYPDDADAEWARAVLAGARDQGITWVEHADAFAELRSWDVFAMPSRRDPFPLAVLEAMACGLPVVASRVDGIPEQVGDAGRLVEPDDPRALADALLELARRPELRVDLGRAARARVEEQFTLERQAAGLHEAYLAAAGGA